MYDGDIQLCSLLCRCRTGSTALTKAISAHPHAMAFHEILNGIHGHSYQNFVIDLITSDKAKKSEFMSVGPLFAFQDYLNKLVETARKEKPELKICVIECKIENMNVFSSQWSHPSNDFVKVEFLRLALNASDNAMFLRRRNVLERRCSNRLAHHTGVFHSTMGKQAAVIEKRPIDKETIKIPMMLRTIREELEYDARLFEYISSVRPRPMLIEYEDAYDESGFTPAFLERFAAFSGGITLGQPPLSKVRSLTPKEMIANYDPLVAAIRNSPMLSTTLLG